MIFGVGTDLVLVARLRTLHERHGLRAEEKMLSAGERNDLSRISGNPNADLGRFLAKRFAAKEAFGKAMGTGIRAPLTLPAIGVAHDELGKPCFHFSPELEDLMAEKRLYAHLSISDEQEHALAFVVVEFRP